DENLEAIAHAEDARAAGGVLLNRLHDRRHGCEGARAQRVAIGETARDEDGVDVVRHLVLVPDLDDIAAKHIAQGVDGVALAVRSGEDNDGPACGHRAASLESTMLHVKSSRSGLLSVS